MRWVPVSDVIRITLFLRLIVILSDTLQTEECLFEYGNDLCNACQIPVNCYWQQSSFQDNCRPNDQVTNDQIELNSKILCGKKIFAQKYISASIYFLQPIYVF